MPIKSRYSMKDFLPLIIIFSSIIALSLFTVHYTGQSNWHDLMRYFMGYFFVVFGLFKILNFRKFVVAYLVYDIIAQQSILYAYGYPFIELMLGSLYLLNWFPVATNILTLVIMLVSAYGVYKELRKKNDIVCACLGTVFKIPMTYVTLLEDLLMAAMALIMLVL